MTVDSGSNLPLGGEAFTLPGNATRYYVTSVAGNVISFTPSLVTAASDNAILSFFASTSDPSKSARSRFDPATEAADINDAITDVNYEMVLGGLGASTDVTIVDTTGLNPNTDLVDGTHPHVGGDIKLSDWFSDAINDDN